MVGFVVPLLADNPPAYSLALVTLHLKPTVTLLVGKTVY